MIDIERFLWALLVGAMVVVSGCGSETERAATRPAPTSEAGPSDRPSPTDMSEEVRETDCADRITSEDRARVEEPFAHEPGYVLDRQAQFQRVGAWAEGLYPSAFAGGWLIDHPAGKRMVLAFTDCAEERTTLVTTEVGVRRNLVDAKVVPLSLAQLRAIRDRVHNSFDELQAFGVHSFSTHEPTNSIKVYSEAPLSEQARAAIRRMVQSTALTFEVAEQAQPGIGGADG